MSSQFHMSETAINDVLAERKRQMVRKGWSMEHDDAHDEGELARAAACYALNASCVDVAREVGALEADRGDEPSLYFVRRYWPWEQQWWKPSTRRRDLVKAAALLIAEIERLDRRTLNNSDR